MGKFTAVEVVEQKKATIKSLKENKTKQNKTEITTTTTTTKY